MTILEVTNLKKIYTTRLGLNQVQALTNVSFTVEEGEYVAIMGESGSGKTTLLNIIASLDKASSGDVVLDGKSTSTIKEKDISAFRRNNLGFVFQDFNLLDTFSVQDNIFLPLVLSNETIFKMSEKLRPIAQKLGIQDILSKYPYEISGGQKQRVAVARALITNPKLILADEPTGNLDPETSQGIIELLERINDVRQTTVLVVTHDREIVQRNKKRTILIEDGCVTTDTSLGGYQSWNS